MLTTARKSRGRAVQTAAALAAKVICACGEAQHLLFRMPPGREATLGTKHSHIELNRSVIRRRGTQILRCCNSRKTPALLGAAFVGCAR
jgi:hypothetical protein